MSKQLNKTKAEACLAAVKEQFKEYLGDGAEQPKLYEPGFHDAAWTIAWESGPYEWACLAFTGGFDEEIYELAKAEFGEARARELARKPAHPRPDGVFTEPLNHWALCLYPEG